MATIPQHTLFFVITGRNINGPRQQGEVLDVDELGIRNAMSSLLGQGAVAAVPYGSEFVEADGIVFVNAEFAQQYEDYLERRGGQPALDSDAESGDGSEGDDDSPPPPPPGETPDERLARIGDMLKPDMTAEALALGITVDSDWTKAEIMDRIELRLAEAPEPG